MLILIKTGRCRLNTKIGVLDSGIGGLTVVKSLQKLLPNEDIIYFGDNKNVPYGNKSSDEILYLTMDILNFMSKHHVKIVAVGCNTISTLIDLYKNSYEFPIIDIIHPTVDHLIKMNTYNISIIGTEFTIESGAYQKLLLAKNLDLSITAEGSKILATLIDKGDFNSKEIRTAIANLIDKLYTKADIYNLVLGCTHFPIVEDIFREIAPHINIIDPGFQQAKAIRTYLEANNQLKKTEPGSLNIYTSGDIGIYKNVVERLNLKYVKQIMNI